MRTKAGGRAGLGWVGAGASERGRRGHPRFFHTSIQIARATEGGTGRESPSQAVIVTATVGPALPRELRPCTVRLWAYCTRLVIS
jgi:hypothetical protein